MHRIIHCSEKAEIFARLTAAEIMKIKITKGTRYFNGLDRPDLKDPPFLRL